MLMLCSVTGSFRPVRHAKRLAVRMSALLPTISLLVARSEGKKGVSPNPSWAQARKLIVPSYVAALELRIEKLERRLTYARSRKASVALHEQDAPPSAEHPQDRKDSLANIRAAIHRKAERKRENSDVNALVSDFGYMYVSALSLTCLHY